jgi:hypothetical protein
MVPNEAQGNFTYLTLLITHACNLITFKCKWNSDSRLELNTRKYSLLLQNYKSATSKGKGHPATGQGGPRGSG